MLRAGLWMAVDGSYTRGYYGLFYCNSMGLFEKYDAQSLLGHQIFPYNAHSVRIPDFQISVKPTGSSKNSIK